MAILDASFTTASALDSDVHNRAAVAWFEVAYRTRLRLSAPAILLAELGAAVRRVTGDSIRAAETVAQFSRVGFIRFYDADIELCNAAAEIAIRYSIKGCDAIYVALAQQLDEPLVTFDREQAERAAAVIRVIVPA